MDEEKAVAVLRNIEINTTGGTQEAKPEDRDLSGDSLKVRVWAYQSWRAGHAPASRTYVLVVARVCVPHADLLLTRQ